MSAAAIPVAPNLVRLRVNAAHYADVHGDEFAAYEPKQTFSFSVPRESVALAAMDGVKLSFEATIIPFD